MTPEERQLISGLFERMRPAANQPRDREAEDFISQQLRQQPYAPYLLSQTVIVQDQALRAAKDRIEQLEAQQRQDPPPAAQDTSFLGGLGRSIFGAGQPDNRGPTVPSAGHSAYAQDPGQFRAPPAPAAPAGGPWSQAASQMGGMAGGAGAGGGFLKGALGAAAGVAGGVLLADGIRNLFTGGNNPYGIASGLGGLGGGFGNQGGETIVNNYYDSPDPGGGADYGDAQDAGDFGGDTSDPGSYGGGGYSNDT